MNKKDIQYKNANEEPSATGRKDNKIDLCDVVKTYEKTAAVWGESMDVISYEITVVAGYCGSWFVSVVVIFCRVSDPEHI
jgi:hypothetical protein